MILLLSYLTGLCANSWQILDRPASLSLTGGCGQEDRTSKDKGQNETLRGPGSCDGRHIPCCCLTWDLFTDLCSGLPKHTIELEVCEESFHCFHSTTHIQVHSKSIHTSVSVKLPNMIQPQTSITYFALTRKINKKQNMVAMR